MLKFDTNGDLEKVCKVLENENRTIIEKKLVETAGRIVEQATLLSPVGKTKKSRKLKNGKTTQGRTGGLLRKSWKISNITRQGNAHYTLRSVVISNDTEYAAHVEFGHRTRLGKGKIKSRLGGKKYVEGQFFLNTAFKDAIRRLD